MKACLDLLWTFIVIGATTFGGGYAMIPVLERELIKKRRWTTMDEVMDYYTIAQITPGIIAVNTATFVGYKRKGVIGGIIATIGFVLPGLSLMLIVSLCISRFAEYPAVQHAFAGIRLAVCALILDTVIKLFKNLSNSQTEVLKRARILRNFIVILISVIAFALSVVFSVSPVYIILGAGIAGLLLFSPKRAADSVAATTNAATDPSPADTTQDDKP